MIEDITNFVKFLLIMCVVFCHQYRLAVCAVFQYLRLDLKKLTSTHTSARHFSPSYDSCTYYLTMQAGICAESCSGCCGLLDVHECLGGL